MQLMLEEHAKTGKEILHRRLKIIQWHWKKIPIGWGVQAKEGLSNNFKETLMILIHLE